MRFFFCSACRKLRIRNASTLILPHSCAVRFDVYSASLSGHPRCCPTPVQTHQKPFGIKLYAGLYVRIRRKVLSLCTFFPIIRAFRGEPYLRPGKYCSNVLCVHKQRAVSARIWLRLKYHFMLWMILSDHSPLKMPVVSL